MAAPRSAALLLAALVAFAGATAGLAAATQHGTVQSATDASAFAPPAAVSVPDGNNTTATDATTTDSTLEDATNTSTTTDTATENDTAVTDSTAENDTATATIATTGNATDTTAAVANTTRTASGNATDAVRDTADAVNDTASQAANTTTTAVTDATASVTNATAAVVNETTAPVEDTLSTVSLAATSDTSVQGVLTGSASGDATGVSSSNPGTPNRDASTDQRATQNRARDDRMPASSPVDARSETRNATPTAPRPLPAPPGGAVTATALLAAVVAVARPPALASASAWTPLRATASARLHRWLDRARRFILPAGYSRYDDTDPLDHDTRAALHDAIHATPGVYLSDLAERTDVNLSTARHHVRVLRDENLVCTAKRNGKRRYYPATVDDIDLATALADPATAAVLDALAEHGEAHCGLLADELDRDPSTVTHHLQRLETDGLVERERRGRTVVNRLTDAAADAIDARDPAPADD